MGAFTTIAERPEQFASVHAKYIGTKPEPEPKPKPEPVSSKAHHVSPADVDTVLEKMFNSEHGAKWKSVYEGDTSGYVSHSEADLGLCQTLAYWTDGDAALIDACFRESGLMRLKWDELRGAELYGVTTIEKAVKNYWAEHPDTTQQPHLGSQTPPTRNAGVSVGSPTEQAERAPLEVVNWAGIKDELPSLAPVLIGTNERGLLRRGHKLLMCGPSKANKSWGFINLALSVATGTEWLGYPCTRGRVLYVNLEVDARSFGHRINKVWQARHLDADAGNLDILNLRGKGMGADTLADAIVGELATRGYSLIIIDPIYKILTGDENSAGDMSRFVGQFDRIAEGTGASVAYIHHYAKGAPGAKRSIDRMSGSGVFARDPDAILDLAPLDVPAETARHMRGTYGDDATAWRMTATLREFKQPEPIDLVFRYPVHEVEATGMFEDCDVQGENPGRERRAQTIAESKDARAEKNAAISRAVEKCGAEGVKATKENVYQRMEWGGIESVTLETFAGWTNQGWCHFKKTPTDKPNVYVYTPKG